MTFQMPQEFSSTQPVLYTAWSFSAEEHPPRPTQNSNKLNYMPRLIFVYGGQCRFFFPEQPEGILAQTGAVVYIPPSVVYHTQFSDTSLLSYNLNFDFMPGRVAGRLFTNSFVRRIPQLGEEDRSLLEDAPRFTDASEFSTPFFLHAPELLRQAEELVREIETPAQFSQMRCDALLSTLLVQLIRQLRSARAPRTTETYARISAYIEAHIGERLSGEELSDALHYHPYYMNRVVHEISGESLHHFILRAKMRHARQLLSETDMPIGDIAMRLGFCDASHFAQVFASHEGASPTRYRAGARGR